jgi:hypothetical protein
VFLELAVLLLVLIMIVLLATQTQQKDPFGVQPNHLILFVT